MRAAYIAFILACCAGALGLQGTYPTADSALFEYCGRVIARGGVLYRDVWDDKFPGVYYVNAFWQVVFGERYALHAAAETLLALTSAALLVLVMRDFNVRLRSAAAAVLTAFLCLAFPLNSTEAYALPLILAALAVRRSWTLSGVFLGAAASFWIPSLLMLPALFTLLPQRRLMRGAAMAAIAVALPLAIVASIAGPARFHALIHTWLTYASTPTGIRVHHHFPILNRFAAAAEALENFRDGAIASGVAPFGVMLLALLRRPSNIAQRFGLLWTCLMLAATFIGTRFYSHYFIACFTAIVFTICAYVPGTRLVPARVALLAACALLLVRTAFVHFPDDSRIRAAAAQRLERAAGPIVARKLTLHVDAYRPELYLALDPLLQNPREIVGASQDPSLHAEDAANADVRIDTTSRPRAGARVCAQTAAPLIVHVRPQLRQAFVRCP